MTEAVVDDIVAVLPPLLNALEALGYFARHLHPPAFGSVMNAIGAPDDALQNAHVAIGEWPDQFTALRERLDLACNETLSAFSGIPTSSAAMAISSLSSARCAICRARKRRFIRCRCNSRQ